MYDFVINIRINYCNIFLALTYQVTEKTKSKSLHNPQYQFSFRLKNLIRKIFKKTQLFFKTFRTKAHTKIGQLHATITFWDIFNHM